MKKILFLTLLTTLILAGCGSKSSLSLTFDTFTMKLSSNDKQYMVIPLETNTTNIQILTQMKEVTTGTETTGFTNSLIITKVAIQSGMDIQELADSNSKELQLRLLKYVVLDTKSQNVKCNNTQYSGYAMTFSYQLADEMLYGGQYFFANDTALYLTSLSSDDEKDVKSFIKSITTTTCTQ